MLGKIFLSVCLFKKSWRTDINHIIVGRRHVIIEYECLFNETCVQASNLTAAPRQFAAVPCRADWPQCLVNETVVFGQIGRALFHLQVTSN